MGVSFLRDYHSSRTGRGFAIGYVSYIKVESVKIETIIGAAAGVLAVCILVCLCCRQYRGRRYESISSCDSDSDSDCCVSPPNYGTTTTTTTISELQPPTAPGYHPPQPGYGPQPGPYKPASGAFPAYPPTYSAAQPGSQPYPPAGYPPSYQPYPPQPHGGTTEYRGNAPPSYAPPPYNQE